MRGAGRWFREIHVEGFLSTEEQEVFDFEAAQFSSYTCAKLRLEGPPPGGADGIEIRARMYVTPVQWYGVINLDDDIA